MRTLTLTLLLSLLLSSVSLAQVAPPNGMGVSMGHLHMISADPEAQKKCWIDGLGGRLVKVGPLEFAMFPGLLVGFRKGDSNGGTEGSVIDHLGFHVNDSANVKASLAAAGAQITRETAGSRNYYAICPGGVEVEIGEEAELDVPVKPHHVHLAREIIRAQTRRVASEARVYRSSILRADRKTRALQTKASRHYTGRTPAQVWSGSVVLNVDSRRRGSGPCYA